jgi:hypothetical protein
MPKRIPTLLALLLLCCFQPPAQAALASGDARFTIFVLKFEGPRHIREAKETRDQLVKLSGLRDFFLIHEEAGSTLYFGRYKTTSDTENPEEARRLRNDLAKLAEIEIQGTRPLGSSMVVPLPTPDPPAPAEWNLINATGIWSLQVAAFKDHPDRKQAAVDSVKLAREQGIDAYFFHGPSTSSVLIGAFPLEAVRVTEGGAASAPPDRELVVVPFMPPGMPEEIEQADGTKSKVVAPKAEILDPLLRDLMRRYPEHAVNGEVLVRRVKDPRTGKVVEIAPPTFLVDIRQVRDQALLAAGAHSPAAERDPSTKDPAKVAPSGEATPGSGKLKSVGQ